MPVYNIVTKENCEQSEHYIKGDMNNVKTEIHFFSESRLFLNFYNM